MNWLQLGGSIIAILLLAGLAWWLQLGAAAPLTSETDAALLAETNVSGFDSIAVWLSQDRFRAVVIGSDGGTALIRPHGAHHVVRRIAGPRARRMGQFVEIDSDDQHFGRFSICLADQSQAVALLHALRSADAGTLTDMGVGKQA